MESLLQSYIYHLSRFTPRLARQQVLPFVLQTMINLSEFTTH